MISYHFVFNQLLEAELHLLVQRHNSGLPGKVISFFRQKINQQITKNALCSVLSLAQYNY